MLARGPIAACEERLGTNYVAAQLLFRRSPVTSIDCPAGRLDSFLILAVFDLNGRSPE